MSEEAALKTLISKRRLHGVFDLEKAGHPVSFYELHNIFIDFRGPLSIHPKTGWGWFAAVITTSHDTIGGEVIFDNDLMSRVVGRGVTIDEGAYIGSFAILYNCHIKHHAIVACGAVVRNMTVEPYTVVEGNPAVATRRFENGKWVRI